MASWQFWQRKRKIIDLTGKKLTKVIEILEKFRSKQVHLSTSNETIPSISGKLQTIYPGGSVSILCKNEHGGTSSYSFKANELLSISSL